MITVVDRLFEVAISGASLAAVVAAATFNVISGVAMVVFGAQVDDGIVAIIFACGTGIIGWALVLLVKLSNVVARLEAGQDDHDRRLATLEEINRAH